MVQAYTALETAQEPLLPVTEADDRDIVAIVPPAPLSSEPSEALREPNDWPYPHGAASLAATAAAADLSSAAAPGEGGCGGRLRTTFRIAGIGTLVGGVLTFAWALLRDVWPAIWQWVQDHGLALSGLGLSLVGGGVTYLTGSSENLLLGKYMMWDDLPAARELAAAGDNGDVCSSLSKKKMSFRIWNDVARFGADAESLEKTLETCGRGPSALQEMLYSEPDLKALAQQSARELSKRQADRAKDARVKLISRCKEDLDGGLSLRRLRQKLEPRCFVVDFSDGCPNTQGEGGDTPAAAATGIHAQIIQLRNVVSFLLAVCSPYDEVVLRINSPGGLVGEYGLASSQLARLRQAGIRLVVCVDVVAASGGYMMACVAERIIAAPFSMLGSIGVVAGVPNLHKLLQRHDVDYHVFTAGRYKRTVDMFTKSSKEGIAKFQADLDAVHTAFTAHVKDGRGSRIKGGAESAATGEVFLGSDALDRGLVDEISTSDEYLRRRACEGMLVLEIHGPMPKRSFMQWLWSCVSDDGAQAGALSSLFRPIRALLGGAPPLGILSQIPWLRSSVSGSSFMAAADCSMTASAAESFMQARDIGRPELSFRCQSSALSSAD